MRFLQCNLNTSKGAQDLLAQQLLELQIDICAVSEPNYIPVSQQCYGSLDGRSAIYWCSDRIRSPCTKVIQRDKFVAITIGDVSVISCYVSPNTVRGEFSNFLIELRDAVRSFGSRVIVCGDFNSKSKLWGSRMTDDRGMLVEDWAAELDLRILNTGNVPTCVRPQGVSVIDLSWATPSLKDRISDWRVLSEILSLSDHTYISFSLDSVSTFGRNSVINNPKWSWKKVNADKFHAAATWYGCEESFNEGAEDRTEWISQVYCKIVATQEHQEPDKTLADRKYIGGMKRWLTCAKRR